MTEGGLTGIVVDVVGWLGAGALLSAYALVSSGRVQGRGRRFQLLNLLGAGGLLVNGAYHGAWPSAGLNTFWLVVAVLALTRLPRAHRLDSGRTAGPPNVDDITRSGPKEPT
jgi:hypothetical protein